MYFFKRICLFFFSYVQSKFLIASEVVQLLCIVPPFFDFVTKDPGVKNLVAVATNDHLMVDKISKYVKRLDSAGVSIHISSFQM